MVRTPGLVLLLGLPALAQTPLPPASTLPTAEPVLVEREGELWGLGDRYKARFDRAVKFVPAFGERAPHNTPIDLQTLAFGRGDRLQPAGDCVREYDGLQVRYPRPGMVERYDVLAAGIEQSFVFDTLPAGTGDLVVEVGLRTELAVEPAGDGLRFVHPGIGHLTLGGVTGIDADGDTVRGRIELQGDRLRLCLPEAFVAEAALPLVLDPLLGGVIAIDTGAGSQRAPDVARDVLGGNQLVVYNQFHSSADSDVYAVVLNSIGNVVGTRIPLAVGTANDTLPQVAYVLGLQRFVVLWNRAGDIVGLTTKFAGTGLTPIQSLVSGPDTTLDVDVGGEQSALTNRVIATWRNATSNRIDACSIDVSAAGVLTTGTTVGMDTPLSVNPVGRPRISKQTGTGEHLVVWTRDQSSQSEVWARLVRPNASSLTISLVLQLETGPVDCNRPDVDGTGSHWLVAWTNNASATDGNVEGRAVRRSGTVVTTQATTAIETDAAQNEFDVAVGCTGGSFVVGWNARNLTTGAFSLEAVQVDLFSCANCGTEVVLPETATQQGGIAIAGEGTSAFQNEALIAWDTVADVKAARWTADDGVIETFGGNCGAGGTTWATCARIGNPSFAVRLSGADAATAATLVVSPTTWNLPCNTCRLIPDPVAGFLFFSLPVSNGEVEQAIAIPPDQQLLARSFWLQWLVHDTETPSCASFGTHFSNTLRATIQ